MLLLSQPARLRSPVCSSNAWRTRWRLPVPKTPHSLSASPSIGGLMAKGGLGNLAIYGPLRRLRRVKGGRVNVGSCYLAQIPPADLHTPSSVNWRRRRAMSFFEGDRAHGALIRGPRRARSLGGTEVASCGSGRLRPERRIDRPLCALSRFSRPTRSAGTA
jgi:hypothetical protein